MKNANIFWRGVRGLTVMILLSAISACGGGSATTPNVSPAPTSPVPSVLPSSAPTSAEMNSVQKTLIAGISSTGYTDLRTIPVSGGATYEGIISGDLANTTDRLTDTVIGELALNVSFNASSAAVSGTAANFRDDNGEAMTGNLVFSGGALNRDRDPENDATLTLLADGNLRDATGRNLVFGVRLEGDFLGDTYNAVGGDALGRVTYDDTIQDFDGTFIAKR